MHKRITSYTDPSKMYTDLDEYDDLSGERLARLKQISANAKAGYAKTDTESKAHRQILAKASLINMLTGGPDLSSLLERHNRVLRPWPERLPRLSPRQRAQREAVFEAFGFDLMAALEAAKMDAPARAASSRPLTAADVN